jgi:hypothetical protein
VLVARNRQIDHISAATNVRIEPAIQVDPDKAIAAIGQRQLAIATLNIIDDTIAPIVETGNIRNIEDIKIDNLGI